MTPFATLIIRGPNARRISRASKKQMKHSYLTIMACIVAGKHVPYAKAWRWARKLNIRVSFELTPNGDP